MFNALRGLHSLAATENSLAVAALGERNAKLVDRLSRYSFTAIATACAGLLTVPANQPATYRIEALIALAGAHARGTSIPTTNQVKEWLNTTIRADLGQQEDPPEDVFVSAVPYWEGNARLFDGWWGHNDFGVKSLMWALMQVRDRPWADTALDSCMAMLTISETIAQRAGIPRFSFSEGVAGQSIEMTSARMAELRSRVQFSMADLQERNLRAKRLAPFVLREADRDIIASQSVGGSVLDRKPLYWDGTRILAVVPTAIGAAIRMYILAEASAAGDLDEIQKLASEGQFSEMIEFGVTGLRAKIVREPEPFGRNHHDLVATFDEGGYVHLVYAGDDFADVLDNGLRALDVVPKDVIDRADAVAAEMSAKSDYRRGMTMIVHGGVGRGFALAFTTAPPGGWHRVGLECPDFARFTWEHGFDALRVWKIAQQEEALPLVGYGLGNINGFANLYGFMRERFMAIVPDEVAPGRFSISPGHVATIRSYLRDVLDVHVVPSPDGRKLVEVRRSATDVFFDQVRKLPLFVSPMHLAHGRYASCVETNARLWWVSMDRTAKTADGRALQYQLWDMTQNWMLRAAPRLEHRFPKLRQGPVSFRLDLPSVDEFNSAVAFETTEFGAPDVRMSEGELLISSSVAQLAAFARADNVGERNTVAALVRATALLAEETLSDEEVEALVLDIVKSPDARFLHMLPPRTPSMLVYAAAGLGRPRLVQDEDYAWSRIGLAEMAGWTSGDGAVPPDEVRALLKKTVDVLWSRMRALMIQIDRESLTAMALNNHDATAWDRHNWGQTAQALLALYDDAGDIVAASNRLESQRGIASLGSRVIAEMAISTCPETGGRLITHADFDALLADLALLIECANQDDAIHWNLAKASPVVMPNGALVFDQSFLETQQRPYMDAHGERAFRASAKAYAGLFAQRGEAGPLDLDPRFLEAFEDEYGLGILALARFVEELSAEAAAQRTNLLRLRRSEVISRLAGNPDDFPALDPDRAFDALTLKPRPKWDEEEPQGGKAKDWFPWRFSRRLALLQRPMAQVGTDEDPLVLLLPTLLDNFVSRIFLAESGSLPVELYSGAKMRSWIGTAVNREGHAFNALIAAELRELGWTSRSDVKMTELGGTKGQGDVDVLAWNPDNGLVLAIECKRLQRARSIGEIGERLWEYGEIAPDGQKPTPIQKHVTRIDQLRSHPANLSRITGIAADAIDLQSILVTDHLVPMQFSKRASALVDLIVEYSAIPAVLALNGTP